MDRQSCIVFRGSKAVTIKYEAFLKTKSLLDKPTGLKRIPKLSTTLKPFQAVLTGWALKRGRAALFEGTGLGKTIQQLSWARAVIDHEKGKILIFTPLAVAEQTVSEAEKFGMPGVAYAAR